MFYYRLYFFNGARIVNFKDFAEDSDAEALIFAEGYAGTQMLELWRGQRRIGMIEPRRLFG